MSDAVQLFAEMSRLMSAEKGLRATLDRAVQVAVDLTEGCEHASVTGVVTGRTARTEAATSTIADAADSHQYETNEGPCLQAIVDSSAIASGNLPAEERWPAWAPRVTRELGLGSVLSLPLTIVDRPIGSLNLYSSRTEAFDATDVPEVEALSTHVAVAMAAAHDQAGLEAALANRIVIGQAEGRLMQRYGLDADEAFAVLVRASQDSNRKLVDIARQIADEGLDLSMFVRSEARGDE